ncbi:hypothetical protein R1flu_003525 [Riccia fluitans]|uniref:Uncharacterized protein n=1 Tax=Riccia fluitans TaxID=41844 RepID=A0ABD1Y9D8_9MARC
MESEGGQARTSQDLLGEETEATPEPQLLQASHLEQPLVQMETTAEKRKRVSSEKENRRGLEMTDPVGAGNSVQNETPKGLNLGQTQHNNSMKQGGKKTAGFAFVHGPRDRTNRARLWKWLAEICTEGIWVLGGDWNSVETWEDSVGESPIQRGTEQRRWNALAAQLDLADGWTKANP